MKRALFSVTLIGLAIACSPTWALGQPVLYATDATSGSLFTVDPLTAATVEVGPLGVSGEMVGLGFDPFTNTMYGTTTGTNQLYSINYATGNATLIGDLGVTDMHALEFDTSTGRLFGAVGSPQGDGLYEINTTTGQASLIGHIGSFHPNADNIVRGLAVHPLTNVLYGVVSGEGTGWTGLIEIDKSTAAGSLLGSNSSQIAGLAFHPDTNTLYGINDSWGTLHRIDTLSGATTLVSVTSMDRPSGLAFTPEPTTLSLLALALLLWPWRKR